MTTSLSEAPTERLYIDSQGPFRTPHGSPDWKLHLMLKYAHRGEGTRNPTTLDLEGFDELIQTLKTRGLSDFHPRMVAHAKEMIAPLYSFADSLRYPKSSAHRNDRDVAKGWSTLRLALLLEEASFKVREQIENKHCAE